jgi:hypothetical protein
MLAQTRSSSSGCGLVLVWEGEDAGLEPRAHIPQRGEGQEPMETVRSQRNIIVADNQRKDLTRAMVVVEQEKLRRAVVARVTNRFEQVT